MPRGLARRFEEGEKTLQKILKGLRQPVAKLDSTLTGALETSERKMLYQFAHLQEKVGARHCRSAPAVLDGHERELILELLYPHGELQERSLCFLPIAGRARLRLARRTGRAASPRQHPAPGAVFVINSGPRGWHHGGALLE